MGGDTLDLATVRPDSKGFLRACDDRGADQPRHRRPVAVGRIVKSMAKRTGTLSRHALAPPVDVHFHWLGRLTAEVTISMF